MSSEGGGSRQGLREASLGPGSRRPLDLTSAARAKLAFPAGLKAQLLSLLRLSGQQLFLFLSF